MRRPMHTAIETGFGSPRRQVLIIGSVVALHALLGYAIVTGLAQRIVLEAPNLLAAEVIPQKEIPQPPPPPPAKPELAQPTVPTVPMPVIRIARPHAQPVQSITVVHGPPQITTPAPRPVVAPPAPEPVPAIAPTPPRSVAGTHTIPPYPDLARRLGESGTVRLSISLDKTGAVSAVSVAKSSGHERLDQAAVDWVRSHWRYRAATRNGQPVVSSVLAEVVFDLRNAR